MALTRGEKTSGAEAPDRLLRNVGLRIAELRSGRGWSREDFAELLGVTGRYVARIEAGRQNLTVHRIAWLARHLETRAIDLFAQSGILEIRTGRPRRK
jgi:transcriptional regulator with XRE-family HTH domain